MNIIIQLADQFDVNVSTMMKIIEDDYQEIVCGRDKCKKGKGEPDIICKECAFNYYKCKYTKENCPYRKNYNT